MATYLLSWSFDNKAMSKTHPVVILTMVRSLRITYI